MALKDYSAFIYGYEVRASNQYINFSENGIDQIATLVQIGSYTMTSMADAIATALNSAGAYEYEVTLDRQSRKYTISTVGNENFDLLIFSGNNKSISIFNLIGFTGADLLGANNYESNTESGSIYITQTPLKDFSDFSKNKEKAEASINSTPSGLTEVIAYSTIERLKLDLPLITNYIPQRFIRETVTGVEEAEAFMDYAINKKPIEFCYSYKDLNNYVPCILDKTKESSNGVGYELKEKTRQALPFYYELTGLVFRKIED